jgi:ribosomal protein S6--L-glutamate ligase
LILEVNSSPGLEGIEKATGINIAEEIIKYVAEGVRKKSFKRDQAQ